MHEALKLYRYRVKPEKKALKVIGLSKGISDHSEFFHQINDHKYYKYIALQQKMLQCEANFLYLVS